MGNSLRLQLVSVHPIRLTRSYLHPLSPQSPFPRDLSLIHLHQQPRIIIRRRVHPPSHPNPRQHIPLLSYHILNPRRHPGPPNTPITLKHHRHPMMDPRHKPRCIHCQHGERINPLVPIHPPVPQPREHHRLPVPPRHIPRLLVLLASHRFPLIKPTHRHHTPPSFAHDGTNPYRARVSVDSPSVFRAINAVCVGAILNDCSSKSSASVASPSAARRISSIRDTSLSSNT